MSSPARYRGLVTTGIEASVQAPKTPEDAANRQYKPSEDKSQQPALVVHLEEDSITEPATSEMLDTNKEAIHRHHSEDRLPTIEPSTAYQKSTADFDRTEMAQLTSQILSRTSSMPAPISSSDEDDDKGRVDDLGIDPNSEDFDLRKWLKFVMREIDTTDLNRRSTGITFRNLNVFGSDAALKLQSTVGSLLFRPLEILVKMIHRGETKHTHILRDCHGFLKESELLLVLGRPGSGCSTFLKTISGRQDGLDVSGDSIIQYNGKSRDCPSSTHSDLTAGIPAKLMHKRFKGEVLYSQEVDKHFPHLTVKETLSFAAAARAPRNIPGGRSTSEYVAHVRQIVMTVFKLSKTANTKVGNDFIRGVSGGER